MRVSVVYATQFGSTREIAERIGFSLSRNGLAVRVAAVDDPIDAAAWDAYVIGSAVHGGHWLRPAVDFVRRHAAILRERPVWLFSSGPLGDRGVAGPQPDPREIGEFRAEIAPRDQRVFAGSFDRATADFDDLGLIERTVVKRFLPEGDWRDWSAIDAWAEMIASQLVHSGLAASATR